MSVTASADTDDIIVFLNTGTSTNFSYVTDLGSAYTYLKIPSTESLALHHHLKEELLFYLGLYNFMAASHISINLHKHGMSPNNENTDGMEHNRRWLAYGFKSMAKIAIKIAEKTGRCFVNPQI